MTNKTVYSTRRTLTQWNNIKHKKVICRGYTINYYYQKDKDGPRITNELHINLGNSSFKLNGIQINSLKKILEI